MISIDSITVEFGGNALFENVSFLIKEKEKIALIGRNGAGKTITRDRRVWLDEKVVDDDSYCMFMNGWSYELGKEYDWCN